MMQEFSSGPVVGLCDAYEARLSHDLSSGPLQCRHQHPSPQFRNPVTPE